MPIKIPRDLPAHKVLRSEGVMVIGDDRAMRQDIRPLQIALLNLMPMKIETETQFARLIGATPLQIEFTLIRMSEHQSRHTAPEHMEAFYKTFEEVKDRKFDGLIITGAPIELLPFAEVSYWDELERIFAWTQTHVHSTLAVCWGAQAMLNHLHDVPKHALDAKRFGAYRHQVLDETSPYLRGFSDNLVVPVSRWTEVRADDLEGKPLKLLITSDEAGPCLIEDEAHRALYMFNHLEYDSGTLKKEYDRDVAAGKEINVPMNYYPDDDPTQVPENRWRSHAHLLYGNWINQIYQTTDFHWVA
ncbi:homoserine O-acetyltransferase MetA [Pontivivens insulae]|uniref:Homoserine O-acetyltransferase n=1 Tax=Pontivivens insulae TaxID=1639689 RepID=A0A2R8AAL1_9RHOB|nr:homoserine O-succinyltransferase [Pontivivens insulae]RED13172.1 homoserine O-succinyltransferase [Pontivivens insulae]SPF29264.1 Homoserine O-succinyltransferase [Pontivivens insulae]